MKLVPKNGRHSIRACFGVDVKVDVAVDVGLVIGVVDAVEVAVDVGVVTTQSANEPSW
jgi:hypothetical protein